MPLHLDNAQFNAFVSFAQNAKDVNSVAGESEPAGPLASRTISVRKDDEMHALVRSNDSRKSNNRVRNLFRDSVVNLFGGEPELTKAIAEHDEEISAGVRDLIPLGSGDAGAMIMAILPAAVPAAKELAAQL